MKHLIATEIPDARIEKDGSLHLRISLEEAEEVMLSLSPELVASLAPTVVRAGQLAQSQQDPTDKQMQVAYPRSIRVLLHKPSGNAFVRFDEGLPHEMNVALGLTLLEGLLNEGARCREALLQRSRN